jgi:hypothetical protein
MTPERKVGVTIPEMPCINHDQYDIDGIRVERFTTAPKDGAQRPPPCGPPPFDVARKMFFQDLDDMQAAHFNALLVPESPSRVYEATRWSLPRLSLSCRARSTF